VLRAIFFGDNKSQAKPDPPLSDWFPLKFRHFRIFGTIFCSKCGGFNAIALAARLRLYPAVVGFEEDLWQYTDRPGRFFR
jgi:hypothetical protein